MNENEHAAPARPVVLGIWQHIPSPMISRYLAQMGWEWVILDLQHGPMNSETAYECIHTIRTAGSKPFLRVPIGTPGDIQRYLDLGAQGIVVPMINSSEEAKLCAQAAKYPPLGGRSFGGDNRIHYGEDYPGRANSETILLVQIEHIEAVKVAEAILAVEGVDGCFVGPTDLALSMGLPHNDFESNPQHRAAIQRTLEACQAAGKMACCNTYSLAEAQAKVEQGYECITLESDLKLFTTAGQRLLADLEARLKRRDLVPATIS